MLYLALTGCLETSFICFARFLAGEKTQRNPHGVVALPRALSTDSSIERYASHCAHRLALHTDNVRPGPADAE